MKASALHKVIWAIDLEGDNDAILKSARALRPLLAATHATVEPVFVLSPKIRIAPKHLHRWEQPFRALAEKRITGLISQAELPNVEKPQVIVEPEPSLRAAVDRLLTHAEKAGADLIVASTHARKGFSRFLVGSFAETLILMSRIPVLTVNPKCNEAKAKISKVLFPTDFSQASRRGFESAIALTKQLGARLCLYYKTPEVISAAFPEALAAYQYAEETTEQLKTSGEAWTDWARKRGVEAELVFDESPGDPDQAIVAFAADLKPELIAMVAQRGPAAAALLGSTTRHVIREADCPVWVQQRS
jgi:nucleotide-binding universal stress UspA family protein